MVTTVSCASSSCVSERFSGSLGAGLPTSSCCTSDCTVKLARALDTPSHRKRTEYAPAGPPALKRRLVHTACPLASVGSDTASTSSLRQKMRSAKVSEFTS